MKDRTVGDLQVAIKQLQALEKRVTEIKRRDTEQVGPDGFGSGAGDGTGRRVSGDHSDPTVSAATQRRQTDLVHDHTVKLLDHVKQACDHANKAAGFLAAIDAHVTDKVGRVNAVECCPVCDDPMPQPRSGFCEPCYRRHVRAGRPERAPWINQERKRLTNPEQEVA